MNKDNKHTSAFYERALANLKDNFTYFLKENDPSYKSKIDFVLSCNSKGDSYKVIFLPVNGVSPEQYFEDTFSDTSKKEKLEKFAEKESIKEFVCDTKIFAMNLKKL
jgi:hypothetical protein